MQVPDNPTNNDIRDALLQLGQQVSDLGRKVERLDDKVNRLDDKVNRLEGQVSRLDDKFDAYQKGTEGMVRMATTIIIATASVVILAGFSPAVNAIITALFA
jgi:predicted nuclease with TOPRIM domain